MPNHHMMHELKEVFKRHTPSSSEDPAWAVVLKMQVLQLEVLEKLMSSIQDMKDAEQKVADGLVALNTSVTAAIADGIGGPAGGGVPPGTTVISNADQAVLDSAVSQANSNAAKIGEIQAALATATPPPAPAPNPPPAPPSPPSTPPSI